VSFLGVIAALAMMRLRPAAAPPDVGARPSGLKEGFAFVAGDATVRALIGIIAVVSVVGMGFVTLMPAWATEILGGDAKTNGWLQSARGVGALVAALTIASLGRFRFKGKLLTLGTFLFPGLVLAFAWARSLPLSLLLLVGGGFGLILIFNLCNALVQEQVPDALRGRVMAIYSLAFFGLLPVGGLIAGLLAEAVGPVWTVTVTASVTLACAALMALFYPAIRRA
jgi:MFS family permease